MISKETARYSIRNLKQRKTRSFFTILSIFIGISTIFIFVSFGVGLYSYIGKLATGSAANKIIIEPKGGEMNMFSSNVKFTDNDVNAVKRASGVYDASGSYFKTVQVTAQDKSLYTLLISYDPKKPLIMDSYNIGIFKGRQLREGSNEVILGYDYQVPGIIFPKAIQLNQNIDINGHEMKVVGFFGEVGDTPDDSQVYASNDYMDKLYPDDNLTYLWIVAKIDTSDINNTIQNVERALRTERHMKKGEEDFTVESFDQMVSGFTTALDVVIGFIILIALISVLVSAVNTANTMITSVLERTKEIGVIKSVGAKNSDVFGIFLFESSLLGFIAGVIGVLVGWGFSYLGGVILNKIGYGFLQPAFPISLFLGCVLFATITGAISGFLPARNASKINPVEALRYE